MLICQNEGKEMVSIKIITEAGANNQCSNHKMSTISSCHGNLWIAMAHIIILSEGVWDCMALITGCLASAVVLDMHFISRRF